MFIREYLNLKEALGRICKEEKIFKFELLGLKAGEVISWRLCPKGKSIIIIDEGICWLAMEKKRILLWAERKNGVKAVCIPNGKKYAIISITDISYTVNKIIKGGLVYCNGPDLKKELKKNLSAAERIVGGMK